MTTARLSLALLVATLGACGPGAKPMPQAGASMSQAIVEPYLRIQSALADDSVDGVRANAGNIATAASALGAPAMRIDTAALQLASAADLADARVKFGALSEAVVTYVTGLHLELPQGVRVAYCPMVKHPWLQEGSTLANPYYGSEMRTCGEFR